MQVEEVEALLAAGLPDCDIKVESDGSHYTVVAVGEVFAGMRAVKRQQTVYALLNDAIASGAIHAVNMRLFTPEEAAQG